MRLLEGGIMFGPRANRVGQLERPISATENPQFTAVDFDQTGLQPAIEELADIDVEAKARCLEPGVVGVLRRSNDQALELNTAQEGTDRLSRLTDRPLRASRTATT